MPQKGFPKIWILAVAVIVVAAGVLVWQRLQAPAEGPVPAEEETPAEVGQPAADETASSPSQASAAEGWKTYQNDEWGFKFKYPDNYKTDTRETTVTITIDLVGLPFIEIIIEPIGNPFQISLGEWVKSDLVIHDTSINWEKIIVDNTEGLKSPLWGNMDGGVEYDVLVPYKEKVFRISFSTKEEGTEKEVKTFNKILSTFRFLEPKDDVVISERPPLEVLKNMEYQLFECPTSSDNYSNNYYYLYDKAICRSKLKDGDYDFYEKISERPGYYESGFNVSFSEATFADLNNDNVDDAIVTLRAYGGGTGSIAYLAAVIVDENGYRNVDTIAIPGEGGVIVTSINNGIISIRSPQHYEVYTYILKISFSEEKGFEIIEQKQVPTG